MLVLSRKKNESIVLNNNITVTVVEIRGDKVRLGIVHPKEIPVHRQEVYDAIHGIESMPAPPPIVAPVQPAPSFAAKTEPVFSSVASKEPSQDGFLDRVAGALQAQTGVLINSHMVAQAILEAAIQELGNELRHSPSLEQLKQLVLRATYRP